MVLFAALSEDKGPTLENFGHSNKLLVFLIVIGSFFAGYLVWAILGDIRRRRSIERRVERSRKRQAQRDLGKRTEG
jgi:hypothetical protein